MSQKTVFISYRRDTIGRLLARNLKEALTHIGYDVFLDMDCIDAGKWAAQILTQIPRRSHFLLLLTPKALDECVDPDDWLRREFEIAVQSNKNIVPIREESVNLEEMRDKSCDPMKAVFAYQAATVSTATSSQDIDALVRRFLSRHNEDFQQETEITGTHTHHDLNFPGWHANSLPDEIQRRIRYYLDCIQRADFVTAYRQFFVRPGDEAQTLNYLLDFKYNLCQDHWDYISRLFPAGLQNDPPQLSIDQRAKVFNALARAYKNTGRLDEAIKTFQRQLNAEPARGETGVKTLTNFINALRLAGRLEEATARVREALELSQQESPTSKGYSLYWSGIVSAARGDILTAELFLRQAEEIFAEFAEVDKFRGLGRTLAHLAQLEIWGGNAQLAEKLARQSYEFAQRHGESRELIFTHRLIGVAAMLSGNATIGEKHLKEAQAKASDAAYFEEQLEADIGLAELDRRQGRPTSANQRLADVVDRARDGRYILSLVDALNGLAQLYRDDGQHETARKFALEAFKESRPGARSYAYKRGLMNATDHLLALGEKIPGLIDEQERPPTISDEQLGFCDKQRLETAKLRCEFAAKMRIITGPYRYAPSKFAKLLKEDWQGVRKIVEGENVQLAPQFVEIHLGEPCNLACVYCRGQLRAPLEPRAVFLPLTTVQHLLYEIHGLNPDVFIRFSGMIGDPLVHPKIIEVLTMASQRTGLKWGLTTNGIGMTGKVQAMLLNAEYVHVSLDAGSDETYNEIKGRKGAFDLVLKNIRELVAVRNALQRPRKPTQIIVSYLLQTANINELLAICSQLKGLGVDCVEVKMQHYDQRRTMSVDDVNSAYRAVDEVRKLDDSRFRVVVVQTKSEALDKVLADTERSSRPVTFPKCYVNALGLNATIDPSGNLRTCCHYYQGMLDKDEPNGQGTVEPDGFEGVWKGDLRSRILRRDPNQFCVNCSPSDEFVNKFVHFLAENRRNEKLFKWIEQEIRTYS